MKVLHVIGEVGPGGAETLLYRMVTNRSEHEHQIVCLGGRDWYSEAYERHGIDVRYLGISGAATAIPGLLRLRKLVRSSGAQLVQTWMYRSNVLGGLAARAAGIPCVWSIHCASFEPLTRPARAMVRLSAALSATVPRFIVNCSQASADLHARHGFDSGRTVVIPNGYDAETFFPDEAARASARAALGVAPDHFLIGTVSRWDAYKDIPNLLHALRLLDDRGQCPRSILVGHLLGPEHPDVTEAIASFGLEDKVRPLGRRGDVADLLRAIDAHVLPSRSEAFPNTVAEAMLTATPCIVTDVGDVRQMVGETGWVVPPRNPEALAAAIDAAAAERRERPAAWADRCVAARQRISTHFSFDRMVDEYEQVWRKAAGEGRVPA